MHKKKYGKITVSAWLNLELSQSSPALMLLVGFGLLIASVVGSLVLMILKRVRGDETGKEYPFGPFIAGGMAIALLFGDPIIQWYLSLLGL